MCFLYIYGCINELKDDVCLDEYLIFEWMDRFDEDFIVDMKCGEIVFLFFLVYFVVFLKKFNFLWYMNGWVESIL